MARVPYHVISLCSILILSYCSMHASSLYESIEAINLHAFTQETPTQNTFATYTEQLKTTLAHQKHLSDYQRRRLAFSIFKSYEKKHPIIDNHIIDETTWRDLNLFVGSASHPTCYVGNKINTYVETELGFVSQLGKLANPTADIPTTQKQQNVVRELIDNEELFTKINTALHELKHHENMLFSWFNEQDPFINNAIFFKWIKTPGWATPLNKISPLMEMCETLYIANTLLILLQQIAAIAIFPTAGLMLLLSYKDYANQLKAWAQGTLKLWPQVNSFRLYGFALYLAGLMFKNNKNLTAVNDVVVGENNWIGLWSTYDQLSANSILLQGLQLKLISLARCVELMNVIKNCTEESPILRAHFDAFMHPSAAFEELEHALQSNMYAGDEWYAGSILSTAKLAYDHHNDCVEMLVAIGEIDALMSLAKLYKYSAASKNSWSFAQFESAEPDFEEQAAPPAWYNTTSLNMNSCFGQSDDEPFMQLDDFWNPLLNHEIAVANTITLGGIQPRAIIITGINKGGKSTNMKGMALNALCAQATGLAPANLYIATPFTKILTYCNPDDDIAQGVSHFEAGEQRALHIYKTVAQLKHDQHALCMLDEAYDGTHPAVSAAATKTLIQHLGYNPHVICITTTHLPEVTKLAEEQNGSYFANYHVASTLHPDKTITYTYQLKPGVSYQNELALELLRQQNYPNEFIEAAYQELEQAKK